MPDLNSTVVKLLGLDRNNSSDSFKLIHHEILRQPDMNQFFMSNFSFCFIGFSMNSIIRASPFA